MDDARRSFDHDRALSDQAKVVAPNGMYLEDFRVGQVFCSPTRRISETDLADFARLTGDRNPIHVDEEYAAGTRFGQRVVHGTFGLAAVFGLLHEMGIVDATVVALLDVHWAFKAPLFVDDEISLRMSITRCRRTSGGDSGVVNRHIRLLNQDGSVVQEGTSAMLVAARGSRAEGEDDFRAHCDFGSLAWGRLVAKRLAEGAAFADAVKAFDGTIGLQAGNETVYLRTYLGRVIDVVRRTQLPADFVVRAEEAAWAELAFASRNDYIARAMHDEFTVAGSNYQYLRLTRALVVLMDSVRALAQEVEPNAAL